jgi:hemolysin D
MRLRFQFAIVSHLLRLFLFLIVLLLTMIFALVWFFRLDVTATGKGLVKCSNWIDIKPEVKGIIREMSVKEGQKVKKGETLFTLEDRERDLEVEKSSLTIGELKSNIAKSKKRLIMAEKEISGAIGEARAALATTQANYRIALRGPKPEEVALGNTRIKRAETYLDKAKKDYEKMKRAYDLKLVSKLEFDGALHQMELAEVELRLSKDELALLLNKYDTDQVAAAKAEVKRCKATLARAMAREDELDLIRQDLDTSRKALIKEEKQIAVLKEHLKLTHIKAPIDGYVLTHDPEHLEGKALIEGETILRLGDTREFIIDCKVSESDFPLVRVGQEARVTIKPFPKGEYKLFKARVITIGADIKEQGPPSELGILDKLSGISGNPVLLEQGYYPVILSLERPYTMHFFGNLYEIKPGFSTEVEIIIEKERIATFLLRRVLRIKGKFVTDNIHL